MPTRPTSSAPTTSCGTSNTRSGCPNTTYGPGPSITAKRDSIEAHLAVVLAALAVSKRIEHLTGWTIGRFVKTLRRYRQVTINTGQHTFTAEQPIPADIRTALCNIHHQAGD